MIAFWLRNLRPLALGLVVLTGSVALGGARAMTLGDPLDRADRLIAISGGREGELLAEYSTDGSERWRPATIYVGATVDEWRPCNPGVWNKGVIEGIVPAGNQVCLWNYFFDVDMPTDAAGLRLREPDGDVLLSQNVDLTGTRDVFAIDRRNAAELAGGTLPAPWRLKLAGAKEPGVESILCPADDPTAPALVLEPKLTGWHRIYLGMEPYSALRFSLSGEGIVHAVPDYLASPRGQARDRLLQEFYLKSADLTGQDVCLAIGGARGAWRDASVRHVRFVPMTEDEVAHHQDVRRLAETRGRPFAGYMEQVTPAHYEPMLTLRDHTRNEMRLHKDRGCTDVYVHVIRLGIKAWYHSDIVEREIIRSESEFRAAADRTRAVFGDAVRAKPEDANWEGAVKWAAWMQQGDPLAVAIEEARRVGLRVFADMGMNVTHIADAPQLTEQHVIENPDYVSRHPMFLDYTKEGVRDYAVAVADELLTKYDVDGIHLDFARWGYIGSYDEDSLVDVVRRIEDSRRQAERKWEHPIAVAVRIPSYYYKSDRGGESTYGGDHPWFVAALEVWAQNGWIDRVMPCSMSQENRPKLSMERYAKAIEGTDVKLWGDLYWQGYDTPRSHHLDIARKWVAEGLNGGFFFYAHHRPTEYERINWMLRLIDFPEISVEP